jgi:heme A synthase
MPMETLLGLVESATVVAVVLLMALLAGLVVIGLANGVVVTYRTIRNPRARHDFGESAGGHPLAQGFISAYAYIHLIADVLLVLVAIELVDTLHAFLAHEEPKQYLLGVVAAALVAIARRIIVFFNPEAQEVATMEIFAYTGLLGVLTLGYVLIAQYG